MRIAVLDRETCKPHKCSPFGQKPCIKYCPMVRTGVKTINLINEKKIEIFENLCSGCGICVKKCPFNSISIVNLPDMLRNEISHRYAIDGFALFRMAIPKKGSVLGLIGPNGCGKSTMLKILAGEIILNLGKFGNDTPDWNKIINQFKGSELQGYFIDLREKNIKIIHKPQNITDTPKRVSGKVGDILKGICNNYYLDEIIKKLNLSKILNREISVLSGGELQRMLIAVAVLRNGDVYLIDEPTSYLDVSERIKIARIIRSLAEKGKTIVVVEHDLAILDYLSDYVAIFYGKPGVYGIISHPQSVRNGINIYLQGYIKDENMRIREESIIFHVRPPQISSFDKGKIIFSYNDLETHRGEFHLKVSGSEIHAGEVIGILGPNAIGKTTFINLIANQMNLKKVISQKESTELIVSIKPQYIKPEQDLTVGNIISNIKSKPHLSPPIIKRLINNLNLRNIEQRKITELSGGELQRIEIAKCLAEKADIFLLDEPCAFLDVEMRLNVAQLIRKVIEELKKAAFVVEHDIVTQDFIADSILIFEGVPGIKGHASVPLGLRDGFNRFLKVMDITFRRDNLTKRPRVNKLGSTKDEYQKKINEFYYVS